MIQWNRSQISHFSTGTFPNRCDSNASRFILESIKSMIKLAAISYFFFQLCLHFSNGTQSEKVPISFTFFAQNEPAAWIKSAATTPSQISFSLNAALLLIYYCFGVLIGIITQSVHSNRYSHTKRQEKNEIQLKRFAERGKNEKAAYFMCL